MQYFYLAAYEGFRGFSYRVQKRFDSKPALFAYLDALTDPEDIHIAASCGFAVADRAIGEAKCIPDKFLRGGNKSILDALARSHDASTRELGKRLAQLDRGW